MSNVAKRFLLVDLLLVGLLLMYLPARARTTSMLGLSATQITTGAFHSCALTTAGAVLCWGSNSNGQLGNNSTVSSPVPVPVSGLGSGVAAIEAGYAHTCALTIAGAVQCWGYNGYGQLGNNATGASLVPVPVNGLTSGVAAITGGGNHSCALTTTGAALCWGFNSHGQLGNNSITNSLVPVPVSGLGSGAAAIKAGDTHTCARTTAGAVQCWGWNIFGQLGDATNTERHVPVPVSGLGSGVAAITTGYIHTCARTTSGALQCWGYNGHGELGNASIVDSAVPMPVSGLGSGVAAITAGEGHSCARIPTSAAQCWGWNNAGQLGDGTTVDRHVPVAVSGLGSGVAAIEAGGRHTCALTLTGAVLCWGRNDYGQLGDNSNNNSLIPVPVSGLGGDTLFANGFDS